MRHAVVITGTEHVLEDLTPSFAGAVATIRKREGEWILESASFEPYESDEKLYQTAKELVSLMHWVLALYLGLYHEPLTIRALLRLTDDDKLIARRRYASMAVNVFTPARQGLPPTASGSLGTVLLSRAATDPAIKEALSLVGNAAINWSQVYDIIEFLGGAHSIQQSGFAVTSETRRVRQTANHYRHLGNPKPCPLPPNPPTLDDARSFAIELLKKWIATRLQ
jgi:hypothetical protein